MSEALDGLKIILVLPGMSSGGIYPGVISCFIVVECEVCSELLLKGHP